MKILHIDIETAPNLGLFFGLGKQYISHEQILEERKVICASSKWDRKKVKTVDWGKKQQDKHIIEHCAELIDNSDLVVAQNGKRFDISWLRGRAMVHGIPFPETVQIFDTYLKARSAINMNCLKLDYMSKLLFNDKKVDTGGFPLWVGCYKNDPKSLKNMITYCEHDVRLLEKYFHTLKEYVPSTLHAGVMKGKPAWTCPKCGSYLVRKTKMYATKAGGVRHYMRCDNGHNYTLSNTEHNKYENR